MTRLKAFISWQFNTILILFLKALKIAITATVKLIACFAENKRSHDA